ncbi:hypothetical protein D3C73_1389340 [compost metagenome]
MWQRVTQVVYRLGELAGLVVERMEQRRVLASLDQLLRRIGDQLLHTFMNSGRALAFQFLSSHAVRD